MNFLVRLAATFFWVGYLPLAPGTFGSLAGALIAWFFYPELAILAGVFTVTGFLVCRPAQRVLRGIDPPEFVLDEVCGMMLSVAALPKTPILFAAAFLLFRALDIYKPWPVSRIQAWKNPIGILADDLAAGLFVNLILQILVNSRLLSPLFP
ncbi:MAG: phosphatidylglycerophosphatase A [Candidatus Omnitrophica bacterium]|nr:phosphatidylglycerophosphatase A [Candidatus Omnitrophota bacterium]